MTNIEIQTMEAVKRAAYVIADKKIDWEQRRYELTKAAITGVINNNILREDFVARAAVAYADAVIKELKTHNG